MNEDSDAFRPKQLRLPLFCVARFGVPHGVAQFLRFGLGGGVVTLLAAITYWVCAELLHVNPFVANSIGYLFALITGFTIHSRWSFKARAGKAAFARFSIVSTFGFGLNTLWVWVGTGLLKLPPSYPIAPMILITPFVMFLLNRRWVFKATIT